MDTRILRLGVLLSALTLPVMSRDAKSLQGLQGLGVVIERLSTEIERAGVHQTDIRTDVELKLRLAGIKVLSEEELLKQPGFPYLYVNATVGLSEGREFTFYALSCELTQDVTLVRDVHISTVATTWDAGSA